MTTPIVSTKQLIPDGLAGYAKTWVAFLGSAIQAVLPFVPTTHVNAIHYLQIAAALLTVAGVYLIPNAVKPTPPAPVLPVEDAPAADPAGEIGFGGLHGKHEAADPQI